MAMENIQPEEINAIVEEVVRRLTVVLEQQSQTTFVRTAAPPPPEAPLRAPEAPSHSAEAIESGREMIRRGAERIVCVGGDKFHCEDLARYIDHTLLKPDATEKDVEQLCAEAIQYHFASVCVNSGNVELCARLLAGSGVKVCAVVGFPLGAMSTDAKAFETRYAVSHGADEVDMVINVGQLQAGNYAYVYDDIHAVVKAAAGHVVKVILETGLLNEDQKIAGCVLAKAAGADFVKTSTGFGPGGATPEDVALMRRIVGQDMGVKASGGIRDCSTAQKMIESGATRLGASASVSIVKGATSRSQGY
jgi:deoxyribose-phosphate aldolase